MSNPPEKPRSLSLDFSRFTEPTAEVPRGCVWVLIRREDGGGEEHRTAIPVHGLTVGRHPQNELCVTHPTVSGKHAQLFCVQDDLFLKDVGSTNGTLLNGRRLSGMEMLQDGDIIHFGQVRFCVERVRKVVTPSNLSGKTCVAYVPEDAAL
ncbi:MAG: FHA domain-containing protein, partial [Planctomycetaceae bacterium]|nr:FHA domain-containing protein [Planctomycetaceae bacterium]